MTVTERERERERERDTHIVERERKRWPITGKRKEGLFPLQLSRLELMRMKWQR